MLSIVGSVSHELGICSTTGRFDSPVCSWGLPSLLSWSVVGWLVLAKRLTECWLTVGWSVALCSLTAKFWLKSWLTCLEQLTDCMAGGSPLCLAGRWLVDEFGPRDWQNVADCWLVGGLVFLTSKSRLKWLTCLYWLHGWRLPSLLSWSVVGWLVLAKWLTECLADCWLVGGLVFVYCKIETKNWLTCLDQLTDCMAGGSPLCSTGRWLVNWFWKKNRLTECWLTVGWWVAWCFFTSKSRLKWLICLDWLHGWRLPSLLSWSVVGWLVLAKRLTECLADCWWVVGLVFLTAKLRLKTDWLVLISWLTAWLAAPLLA